MAATLSEVTTRPNLFTDWYFYPKEVVNHLMTLRENMVSYVTDLSNDGLTITRISVFKSQEDLDAYLADEILLSIDAVRNAYNEAAEITRTVTAS